MNKILKFGDTYRFKTKGMHKLFNYVREGEVLYYWTDAFADVSNINNLEIVKSQDYSAYEADRKWCEYKNKLKIKINNCLYNEILKL
jgi:hypothetical protein